MRLDRTYATSRPTRRALFQAALAMSLMPSLAGAAPIAALSSPAASPASAAPTFQIDFEKQSRAILRGTEFEEASSALLEMDAVLEKLFVHARIGLFDLYMHRDVVTDRENAERFRRSCLALLRQQRGWIDWMAPIRKDTKAVYDDIEELEEWIEKLPVARLKELGETPSRPAIEALARKADIVEAGRRFSEYMASGASLELGRESGQYETLLLGPTRESFIDLVCFAGLLRPELQGTYWDPSITNWTQSYVDHYKIVALEYTAPGTPLGSIGSGLKMDYASPTGLEQQVAQLGSNWLLSNYFGERIPPSLAGGLAVNLVIDVFGRCETRVDGDLRERRTEAREIFVPGGNPNGGILPPDSAQSRWRRGGGADHFVSVLRDSQREGASKAKKSKDKLRHFELIDDNKTKRTVVHGPYLGAAAADSEAPPEGYYGDRLEFLRAYRTCFLHWLREEGAGSGKKSGKAFAELMTSIARSEDPSGLESLIAETFGEDALSSSELGKKDLEGQFLKWLSKQK